MVPSFIVKKTLNLFYRYSIQTSENVSTVTYRHASTIVYNQARVLANVTPTSCIQQDIQLLNLQTIQCGTVK